MSNFHTSPPDIAAVCRDQTDRRIIELIAEGLADKEIARMIHLSPQTVRNRISHILCLSGARNRTQLAVCFIRSSGDALHRRDADANESTNSTATPIDPAR